MTKEDLTFWAAARNSEGVDRFAADVTTFGYVLKSPNGTEDIQLVRALGTASTWLDRSEVQARLHATFFYQQASAERRSPIGNLLFRATLNASAARAPEQVLMLLASQARKQPDYLKLRMTLTERQEKHIYCLSDAPSKGIIWLPRAFKPKMRRIAAIRAAMRGR